MNILFVCTGNTCRSPMAAALATEYFKKNNIPNTTDSAGLFAYDGEPASENAQKVIKQLGLDLSAHKSKQLTPEILEKADIIVPMTSSHKSLLLSVGVDESKIKMPSDIPDPFGGDVDDYRKCAEKLQSEIEKLWK